MKRMIAISFAAALLLTGCGQVNENTGADISDNELQSDMNYSSTADDVSSTNEKENEIDINAVFKGAPIDVTDSRDSFINSVEDIITTNCIVGLELQEALYEDKINQYSSEGGSIQIQYSTPRTFELKGLDNTKSFEISKVTILIDTENNNSRIGIVCDTNGMVYHLSDEAAEMIVKYLTDNTSIDGENSNLHNNTNSELATIQSLDMPESLDEQEQLDIGKLSNQAIVLPAADIPQNAVYFESFKPEIYDHFIIKNETELELYKQLFNIPLERSGLYSDGTTAKLEYDLFMNEIDNISAQYPFDNYTYITTHLYVPYYRKLLGADIIIDNNMIGIVKRLEHFDDDGKDKPSLSPKEYYWIAAIPKNHLTDDSYIGWNTPPNIEE